jgi:single-strand DNA-binding protein
MIFVVLAQKMRLPRPIFRLKKGAGNPKLEISNCFLAQKLPAQLVRQGGQNMGTINKVILIGRLGKDPEERTTAAGTRVSSFNLATDAYHGGNGDKTTDWHRIIVFGKTAEICNQYLKKGRLVCIEGSIQTRTWEKPPGEKKYITEVVAAHVTFLDSNGGSFSDQTAAAVEAEAPF